LTTVDIIKSAYTDPAEKSENHSEQQDKASPELFNMTRTSRSKTVGLTTVIALMITGSFTFMYLMGLLPLAPDKNTVITAAIINSILIAILIFLISKEVVKILRSRQKGRAASRLHVRIIGLFCLVAAFPAILVAIVAGITLDLGLDRWFEARTKNIVDSSISVAKAYQNESTRVLMGNTLSMAANLDRNRRLYVLDRERFAELFKLEARGRGFILAAIVDKEGEELITAKAKTEKELPNIPAVAIQLAEKGDPVPIPLPNTNLVGAVFKLKEIQNTYLYSLIAVPPAVVNALRQTEINSAEYNALEQNRLPVQFAAAILYLGVCLIVLLSALWMGISVANRIVTPIRRLMNVANEVSDGNLDVRVNSYESEGDLRFLGETFNVMLDDLRTQQSDLVEAKELMDQRARFIEAVLSGVSAAVIGLDANGYITIANRFAYPILGLNPKNLNKQVLSDLVPELGEIFETAKTNDMQQYHEQITLIREGRERTLNVQVTQEEEDTSDHSFVITLDDITDLVSAQRNTAWSDVARRIAHEIKNPLTPIQLSAERIKRRYGKMVDEDREVFDKCTDTIIRQVGDIGRMVDEFSAFARMPNPEMNFGDIGDVVKETVFLQKVGFPDIEFEFNASGAKYETIFDSRMLSQAMINVIKNAAEAVEAIPQDESRKGKISVNLEQDEKNITINVIDNGKGLPETNRQRLLEPYMTTREKGTGLGLAIVRKIFEDHGGSIELLDAPDVANGGHGAMMKLSVPLKDKDPINSDNKKQKESA